jgi:hypothetical protein
MNAIAHEWAGYLLRSLFHLGFFAQITGEKAEIYLNFEDHYYFRLDKVHRLYVDIRNFGGGGNIPPLAFWLWSRLSRGGSGYLMITVMCFRTPEPTQPHSQKAAPKKAPVNRFVPSSCGRDSAI